MLDLAGWAPGGKIHEVKVSPDFAYLYAGEIAKVVWRSGLELRGLLAADQRTANAVMIVVRNATGKGSRVESIDFKKVKLLEIDGPRHPQDLSWL